MRWSTALLAVVFPFILTFALLVGQSAAQAFPTSPQSIDYYPGAFTNLISLSEKVITWRCQERMWVTDDDAYHLIANLGDLGLVLHTSLDAGLTWTPVYFLAGTSSDSTVDVYFNNNVVHIAYVDVGGNVAYERLAYDSLATSWNPVESSTVYQFNSQSAVEIPTLTVDANDVIWVGINRQTGAQQRIQLYYSDDGGATWVESAISFGRPHLFRKAGKLVALSDRVGIVFSDVRVSTRGLSIQRVWAERPNNAALDVEWNRFLISEDVPLPTSRIDDVFLRIPHFSAVVDSNDNVHVVPAVESQRVMYSRRDAILGLWTSTFLTGQTGAVYTQVSVDSNSSVYIMFNASLWVGILQSNDAGVSFFERALLLHPTGIAGVDYVRPRVETPGHLRGRLPVLQQVGYGNGFWGLLSFDVDP